jgi:hypothetical protein
MDTDRGNTHKGALFPSFSYSGHPENSGSEVQEDVESDVQTSYTKIP